MFNPTGRPRILDSWCKETICMRYHRAIKSPPSKQTIKDIEKWIAKMKWLEKIRWKTKKRTEAICNAALELTRHRDSVEKAKAQRWADRYVAHYHSEEIKDNFQSFATIAKSLVANNAVQGFTILTTEKALINNTVIPLLDLRNKHIGKTICIYKNFAEGKTSIGDYYVRS